MKLILNEEELVKKSFEDGYIDKKPTNTIKILIKYYFSKGMDKIQVKSIIDDFLKRNLANYNPVKWDDLLTRLIKNEEKQEHKLTIINEVCITKKELDTIKSLNDVDLEKLAFTYLVYSKIYNQINENESDWVNADRKEIFKDAKTNATVNKQRLMVNDLINLGLIESSHRRNCSNKKVLFVDHASEPEIIVNDFRDIGFVYLKWIGENIGECESCKRLFKVKGKNHKMCKECWIEYRKEYKTKKQREYRKNQNVDTFE